MARLWLYLEKIIMTIWHFVHKALPIYYRLRALRSSHIGMYCYNVYYFIFVYVYYWWSLDVEMVRLNLDFKFTVLNNCTSVLSCFFFFMLLWLCLAFLFQGPYSRRTLTEEMFAARFKETSTVFTFTLIQPRPRVLSQHVWVWGWFRKRTVMYYYFAQFLYKFKILCFILFFCWIWQWFCMHI